MFVFYLTSCRTNLLYKLDREHIEYNHFVDMELTPELQWSVPSVVDGLNRGQRKILFTAFKNNLDKQTRVCYQTASCSLPNLFIRAFNIRTCWTADEIPCFPWCRFIGSLPMLWNKQHTTVVNSRAVYWQVQSVHLFRPSKNQGPTSWTLVLVSYD